MNDGSFLGKIGHLLLLVLLLFLILLLFSLFLLLLLFPLLLYLIFLGLVIAGLETPLPQPCHIRLSMAQKDGDCLRGASPLMELGHFRGLLSVGTNPCNALSSLVRTVIFHLMSGASSTSPFQRCLFLWGLAFCAFCSSSSSPSGYP